MDNATAFVLQGKLLNEPFMNGYYVGINTVKDDEGKGEFTVMLGLEQKCLPFDTVASIAGILREVAPNATIRMEAGDYRLRMLVK